MEERTYSRGAHKCDMSARAWRNRLAFADGGWGWAIGVPHWTKNLVNGARVFYSLLIEVVLDNV